MGADLGNAALMVCAVSLVWSGVDMDHNDAAKFSDAGPAFIIPQHLFCLFFLVEMGVRFAKRSSAAEEDIRVFTMDLGVTVLFAVDTGPRWVGSALARITIWGCTPSSM